MEHYLYYESNGQIRALCKASDAYPDLLSITIYDAASVQMLGQYVSDGELVNLPQKPAPNYIFNYTTKQWEDLRTLQAVKTAQWETIKQARSAAEYAGFTWDGSTFDSDATSQNRITGAVTLAQMSAAFSVDWILADNTVRTLNQADMLQVGATLGAHVAAQFATGVTRRAQIEAATTKEAVEAITW